MVTKGKYISMYLWKQNDEYIGLFTESEDISPENNEKVTVKLFRAKKNLRICSSK